MSFKSIPSLDGLRGISIILVMLCHCRIYGGLFLGGFIGVDIFFVISGFLITSILLKEWDDNNCIDLRSFYIRRAFRLLPALFAMLAVYITIGFAFSTYPMGFVKDALSAMSYVSNWLHVYHTEHDFLEHAWSLSVEEQFYQQFPLTL